MKSKRLGGFKMSNLDSDIGIIEKAFLDYCEAKNYRVKTSDKSNCLRLEISNFVDRTIVNIFSTGTVQIQGKENPLKIEMIELKKKFEENPLSFIGINKDIKACIQKYDIILPEDRIKIKNSLENVESVLDIYDNPEKSIDYRAKLMRNNSALTLTQYNNGTLLIQGKKDELFDECCDLIEILANPADKGIIARYLSSDEELLEIFSSIYTPKLLELAERNVINKLGTVYSYLNPYHKKWFIASECLCIADIPLPEFSPLVMPVSKAFEGFTKKLFVDIGLVDPNYFKNKEASFAPIGNQKDPKRIAICQMETHADEMLKRWNSDIQVCRHFMMHSDESKLTKVDTKSDAEKRIIRIYDETKEIFEYFNDLFNLI